MEQHEASGSNAAEMVGDHDARYSNDLDERYMGSHGMSREHINYRHELDRLGREPRTHTSTHQRWRKEEPWIRAETEIEPLKEEARKQIIEEYERKQRSTKARAEAEEVELIERLQLERQEEMAEEVRVFESTVRKKCDQRKAANIPQLDPPDGSEIRSEERPPTLTDLFQQSLEKGVEDKDGFWSNRYKIPIGPTGAPRVCQWSIFGHDGIVTRDEPASEERLRQITAELRRTGDLVILIENIGHPHVGNLGSLLELPDEAFYGLADFPRCHNHNENESRAHKLTIIDDGIERVFRRARMLSSENSKIKAMIRNLGNSMTATRDLLWFFDLHPEGARRSHVIMSTLLEVIPIILKSLPLIDRSARDIYPQPDAMFLEALTSQVEGQLEECRLHWLFCVKEISITSTASERNNYDAKILCIRAKKGVCRLSFHKIRNTKSAQQFYKLNDDLHSYRKELEILKEHVTSLSKNLPLYLEGYLDDFLVIKQRHAASLPDQLKHMLDRTKDLDTFLINSFQILTSSVNVYESDQSSRQNELTILITVLAFIYVPLTLVTGIFGMNIVQAPDGFMWWSPLLALLVVVAFTALITKAALKGVKLWRHNEGHRIGRSWPQRWRSRASYGSPE